jgi:hypothetical protein
MTACSRRCASSLLALSALLVGCGAERRDVRAVFAAHGIELVPVAVRRASVDVWADPGQALFELDVDREPTSGLLARDDSGTALFSVELYRSADDAARVAADVRQEYAGSFVVVSRRGNALVYWDRKAPRAQRWAVAAALRDLR